MAWQELGKTWHDTNVEYCDVCGNLLIRRAWVFQAADGRTLRACRESDERLHARLAAFEPAIEDARSVYQARQGEGSRT
jgi:NMD protein affecting ribosome stability and mRNA decay